MRKSLVAVTAWGSSDFGSAIWPTTRMSSGTCAGAGVMPIAASIRSAPQAAFQPFFHAIAPALPLTPLVWERLTGAEVPTYAYARQRLSGTTVNYRMRPADAHSP